MTKLKIHTKMHSRANHCAYQIHESFKEFVRLCIINYRKGVSGGVAIPDEWQCATREDSTCVTIYETEIDQAELRVMIASGVIYSESRMVRFRTDIDTTREWGK